MYITVINNLTKKKTNLKLNKIQVAIFIINEI